MEIIYEQEGYRIKHDGRVWPIGELEEHLGNGHASEPVSFVARSMEDYQDMQHIAENIALLLNHKASRRRNSK